jgi:hypothetical protein
MTRRTGAKRTTEPEATEAAQARPHPSLRHRNPLAFWLAIVGAVVLVLSTIGSFLSAFL